MPQLNLTDADLNFGCRLRIRYWAVVLFEPSGSTALVSFFTTCDGGKLISWTVSADLVYPAKDLGLIFASLSFQLPCACAWDHGVDLSVA